MASFKLRVCLTRYPVTYILYFIKCTAKQILIYSITIYHTLAVLDSNRSDEFIVFRRCVFFLCLKF